MLLWLLDREFGVHIEEDIACSEFELCSSTCSNCRHHRTWILYLNIACLYHMQLWLQSYWWKWKVLASACSQIYLGCKFASKQLFIAKQKSHSLDTELGDNVFLHLAQIKYIVFTMVVLQDIICRVDFVLYSHFWLTLMSTVYYIYHICTFLQEILS